MQVFVVVSDNYEEITYNKVRGVFSTKDRAKEYLDYLYDDHIYAVIVSLDIDRFYELDNKTFYWCCVLKNALQPANSFFYIDRLSEQYLALNGYPELNSVIYDKNSEVCRVYIAQLKKKDAEVVGRRILINAAQNLDVPTQLNFNFSFSGKLLG